ncbi:hypothetical protein BSK59_16115 [Paenibacillus odorifer]|uniref:hypothetical protein n=1 Tax=Paenibacillus odorifer TaxID=189426 RepID=UPI00096DD4A0|nr:hypothetical protein [Paenibacillus odorifer]OME54104.1 hypothetical protein BSK59_16115 [Paenibacillus odorifer]
MAIVPKDEEVNWIEFDDNDNCSSECRGWNGEDYRCDCGDRRVSFECLNDGSCICENKEQMIDCPNAYAVAN